MATSRKLQLEIDRCLKKVYEGIEVFSTIWDRMHDTTMNTFETQKKKDAIELRKEIKRLRRLREQIRNWITSEDVKNKSTLIEARKSIETQMERFEANERKAKTKTFSTDGLNRGIVISTEEKERIETNDWLAASIDTLNVQMDQFECEVESLVLTKKKPSKDTLVKIEELKTYQEKHTYHINKLEAILRLFNNMSISVTQIQSIKDDVDYYIESSQETGFEDNLYIYDDIPGLEDVSFCSVDVLFAPRSDDESSDGSVDISCTSVSSQRDLRQDWTKSVSKKRLKATQSNCTSMRVSSKINNAQDFREKPPATCVSNPTNSRSKHWPQADPKTNKTTIINQTKAKLSSETQTNVTKPFPKSVKSNSSISNSNVTTNLKDKSSMQTNLQNSPDDKKTGVSLIKSDEFPCLDGKLPTAQDQTIKNIPNKSWSSVLSSYKHESSTTEPTRSPRSNTKSWSSVLTKGPSKVVDEKNERTKTMCPFTLPSSGNCASESQMTTLRCPPQRVLTEKEEPINLHDRLSVFVAWFFKDYFSGKHSAKTASSTLPDKDNRPLWNDLPPVNISYFSTSPTPANLACSWKGGVVDSATAAILKRQMNHLKAAYRHLPEVIDSLPTKMWMSSTGYNS